ncbi:MAG: Sjogren's syndrome/scleroderma autoantigen 1 family protein [Candidatus Lokiarchaeota archaeon]
MANLLKSGFTMINLACPVCSNPIFRDKNGNIFCPICNRKVVIVNDGISNNQEDNKDLNNPNNDLDEKVSTTAVYQKLKLTIIKKLKEFNDLLESEKDFETSKKIVSIIAQLIDLIYVIDKLVLK